LHGRIKPLPNKLIIEANKSLKKMRKIILIAHTSLDGFVAGQKGELDGFEAGEENLDFVCQLTEEADAALFGRISYELLNNYWPAAKDRPNATKGEINYSNWYNSAKKIVISKTLPNENLPDTIVVGNDIPNEISKIRKQAGKNILIFGSPMVSQSLIRSHLIDGYWIFINPVIFGVGIPLFADIKEKIKLKLLSTKQFSNGEFALNYVVER
jgi:dihydrofolate reductase